MPSELEEKLTDLDWEQARVPAAELVRRPAPLPARGLAGAMVDDKSRPILLALRGDVARLTALVHPPDNSAYELPGDTEPAPPAEPPDSHSTGRLVLDAGRALGRW